MNKGVSISYGDIAVGAKESFIPEATEALFGEKYQIQLQKNKIQTFNYANPCELYQTALDGTAVVFPSNADKASIGLWSEQISGEDGVFSESIKLSLKSSEQYSSQGFTFTFDTFNGIHPKNCRVDWFRNSELITSKEFLVNSAYYFAKEKVENFDEVEISFFNLNMPKNRLKLEAIDYGYGTILGADELKNVKLTQSIDPISSQISINSCGFTFERKTDMDYSFQTQQPLTVYWNGTAVATTFVKNSTRKSKNVWEINSEDYISILDATPFAGGMYSEVMAGELIEEILKTANVPGKISDEFYRYPLSGYIPYTTCREAIKQACFACQAIVNTCVPGESSVVISALNNEVTQSIPLERIMQGQNFAEANTVTAVSLTAHSYVEDNEALNAYEAKDSGSGANIFVKFSEPLHGLVIENGSFVKDEDGNEKKGVNYAYINAEENCVLSGQKYKHIQTIITKNNPVVLASESENVSSITSATLVSNSNVGDVLNKCYEHLVRTQSINLKIAERKNVKYGNYIKYGETRHGETKYGGKHPNVVDYDKPVHIGETVEVATEYLGTLQGRVISQSYNLNGNIIVKETVLR